MQFRRDFSPDIVGDVIRSHLYEESMWSRLPGEILIPVAGKPTSSHVKPDFRVMYGVARRRSRGVSLGSNPGPGITVLGCLSARLRYDERASEIKHCSDSFSHYYCYLDNVC